LTDNVNNQHLQFCVSKSPIQRRKRWQPLHPERVADYWKTPA